MNYVSSYRYTYQIRRCPITGAAIGLTYVPLAIIVTEYYTKTRTIVMGIAASGGGIGQFIFPPLFSHLLSDYGWRGALLILGGLSFNISVGGALMRPAKSLKTSADSSEVKAKGFDYRIFFDVPYILLCIGLTCYTFAASIIYVHLASFAKFQLGVHGDNPYLIYSIIGITSTTGKVVFGFIAHHPRVSPFAIYLLSKLACGLMTYCLVMESFTFQWLCAYSVVYGLGDSVFGGGLLPEMIIRIVGMGNFSEAYGALVFVSSMGLLSGAPIAGEYAPIKTWHLMHNHVC